MRYVVITSARNEEDHIERLVTSMLSQVHRPVSWVVYDDGSTDGTTEVMGRHLEAHPWIRLMKDEPGSELRSFASKAHRVAAAYSQLEALAFDLVAILDADISFGPGYFERVADAFTKDPGLGIAGGALVDVHRDGTRLPHLTPEHDYVPGAVQVFRRACFEQVGGLMPLRFGGVDTVANALARSAGWTVQTLADLPVHHHRISGEGAVLRMRLRQGRRDRDVGYHPLYALGKGVRYCAAPPPVAGGMTYLSGYLLELCTRTTPSAPPEAVTVLRDDQRRAMFGRAMWRRRPAQPT